ncbi:hypothetical protein BDEG_24101 [Batrachochytrium dendrobatidis JEL423]|uniref:Uncharacterized protein n=1 Tax=Batrachochytrium dendrobatidis (strain JEL423) TaxID=403673 RepID=A0A177WKL1_BATDL|nr:hypothetical protein BDEG_24101 [Batrachochytrium dendrobatidis JEL423]
MSNILEETQIHLNGNAVLIKGNDSTVGLYKVLFEVNDIERYRFAIKYKTKEKTNELKFTIKENHKKQALRYWFDIQFGYVLRNIETDDRVQFYSSDNTCFNINDSPLVNSTIDTVLNQLDGDDILEKLKCSNSKWSIENIYEYVLLTTPIPEVSIGASVILPDFIKNSKSIVSFHFARYKYPEIRLDRLSKKAKDLYKDYYKTNVKKCYPKLDIQELKEIESHFFVNVNIYRFDGKKAVMERHSAQVSLEVKKTRLNSSQLKYSRFFGIMANLDDAKVQKRLRLQLLECFDVLPIYGFSSSSYDINIIKKYPPQVLKHSKTMEIKCHKLQDINPLIGDTMNILYEKTANKETALKQWDIPQDQFGVVSFIQLKTVK